MKYVGIINQESRINEYENLYEVQIDGDKYLITIKSGYGKSSEISIYVWHSGRYMEVDPKPYELKTLARDIEFVFGKKHRRVVRNRSYSEKARRKHLDQIMNHRNNFKNEK